MRTATTTGAGIGSVSARGLRAAALRSAVGVRGPIPPVVSEGGTTKVTTITASADPATPMDADIELVAARGRRVAALRSLVGALGRTPRETRSAA
ncbi:hypothetical protein [Streptomyces sp. SID12501]|uniref:Uncharacterized protein n=1 Tax=Streptomyces sp. SID12501 TaxID=2706042 RepID=A0A6B3BJZ7_9ACTN|nr:hypothetical protein [Streptomyces sp. SID12501]NEC85814.1 hypothetical protein [Streptomyces sp. SID12501]